MFMSTPYDEWSADLLEDLGALAYKIASTDANNVPFLRYLARKGRPLILSTAMCDLDEVRVSVDAIRSEGCDELVVLHCTGNYPATAENTNLRAMQTMHRELGVPVGYSDHVPDNVNPIAAVALGAVVYEKHFTLDKGLPGPDHRTSLSPEELAEMVRLIRLTETALGSAEKRALPSEAENRRKLRKSVVAVADISAGSTITREMLAIKRPGTGIAPVLVERLVGRRALRAIAKDRLVDQADVEGWE